MPWKPDRPCWDVRLKLSHAQRDALVDDASGDSLDAVLCLFLAAWAEVQHQQGHLLYGLPQDMDPLEGWIVSALVDPQADSFFHFDSQLGDRQRRRAAGHRLR